MKLSILAFLASTLGSASSFATVAINFNNPFAGGVSSNFANSSGVVSDGLSWGVIIDASGNGFLNVYDGIIPSLNARLNLSVASIVSDDVLIFANDFTSNTSSFLEGDNTTSGGAGGITGITDIALLGGVSAGDVFRIIWFNNTPTSAGTLSDVSFVIPAEGNAVDFDSIFVGVDPIRSSNGLIFSPIPEPSTIILGAFGALGLLRRRRN